MRILKSFSESNEENKRFILPFSLNVHHKALSDLSKSLKTQLHSFLQWSNGDQDENISSGNCQMNKIKR